MSFHKLLLVTLISKVAGASDECLVAGFCSEDQVEATEQTLSESTRMELLSLRTQKISSETKAESQSQASHEVLVDGVSYGNSQCECIGIDNTTGMTAVTVNGATINYPRDLGSHCQAWDAGRHPQCNAAASNKPGWCAHPWCYVDPCRCNLAKLPLPSTYIPNGQFQGHLLYRSYSTCDSGLNSMYDTGESLALGTECAKAQDSLVVGSDNCLCVGVKGKQGFLNATINGASYSFPADTGSYCSTWDQGNHPDCMGATDPTGSCARQWCYVDPCACFAIAAPPTTSDMLPGATYQGRPLYRSYDTCGDPTDHGSYFQPPPVCSLTEIAAKAMPPPTPPMS